LRIINESESRAKEEFSSLVNQIREGKETCHHRGIEGRSEEKRENMVRSRLASEEVNHLAQAMKRERKLQREGIGRHRKCLENCSVTSVFQRERTFMHEKEHKIRKEKMKNEKRKHLLPLTYQHKAAPP